MNGSCCFSNQYTLNIKRHLLSRKAGLQLRSHIGLLFNALLLINDLWPESLEIASSTCSTINFLQFCSHESANKTHNYNVKPRRNIQMTSWKAPVILSRPNGESFIIWRKIISSFQFLLLLNVLIVISYQHNTRKDSRILG